jgi:hypothetical protein
MSQENSESSAQDNTNADATTDEQSLGEKFYGKEDGQADDQQESSSSAEGEPEGDQKDKDPESEKQDESSDEESQKDQSEEGEGDNDYKLSLSEDSPVIQERADEIETWAKEKGLSKEVAQELLEREESFLNDLVASQETKKEEMIKGWAKQCEEHPTHGGEKFKENQNFARAAVKRFIPEKMRKEMVENGLADNPDYFVVFSNIGRAMQDDSFEQGEKSIPATKSTMAERFYG